MNSLRSGNLAADLGINLNTVARAYRELTDAGLLTSARRLYPLGHQRILILPSYFFELSLALSF
jgi:DNA-binding transcriptional MocR family regulator